MWYRLVRFLINLLIRLVARVEVSGWENLPPSGAYIAASNHLGRLEVPLGFYLIRRKDIILLVAEKYKETPVFRWFANRLDAVWIDRFNADFGALRKTISRLQQGQILVMAPEGTRSLTGELQEGKPGAAYLAAKTQIPVVPIGITGTEDARVKQLLLRLKRVPVTVTIGEPFILPPLRGIDREAVLQEYTDEIMCRIAALLPESYRGVYRNHPRLQALLNPNSAPTAAVYTHNRNT